MGFLDKFRKKSEQQANTQSSASKQNDSNQPSSTGKRIKKYTSEGKPVYE